MRLLVITQVVDRNHAVLGFFHAWIAEMSRHVDTLQVICLEEGAHALPRNVSVASLGKKPGTRTGLRQRFGYAARFAKQLYAAHGTYDAVFVHMNQEYVLLAGWYWRLFGIPVYLWRNHYAGTFLTRIAVALARKVFCTSRYSYTARFKKTVLMPVGTDATQEPEGIVERRPRSVLSLGRISPSKNIHVILDALAILRRTGVDFTASIRGTVEEEDVPYLETLRAAARTSGLEDVVVFGDAVPKTETHRVYRAHDIFVNASPSGMLDKTIFSAMAHGCIVLASSKDFATQADPRCVFAEGDSASLAEKLRGVIAASSEEQMRIREGQRAYAERNSLRALGERLAHEIV